MQAAEPAGQDEISSSAGSDAPLDPTGVSSSYEPPMGLNPLALDGSTGLGSTVSHD